MRKIILFLISAIGLIAQTNDNLVTIIPSTNSSGAPVASGTIRFADLGSPRHYVGFVAPPAVTPATLYFQLPPANPAGGCWKVAPTTNVITISSCGGLPGDDGSPVLFNLVDPTKQLSFSLAGFATGHNNVLTPQDASYTLAGTNIAQTFTSTQNYTQGINGNGTLMLRMSDRTLWNLGDFNSNITFPVDAVFSIGTGALRLNVLEGSTINLRTAASATTGSFYTPSTAVWAANLSGNAYSLQPANFVQDGASGNRTQLNSDTLVMSRISGFVPMITMNTTAGTITAAGVITGGGVTVGAFGGGGFRLICSSNTGVFQVTSCPIPSAPPFDDLTNLVRNAGDHTKNLQFNLNGFSTGVNNVLTPQNASYTIAGIDIAQTFSQNQNFTQGINGNGTLMLRMSDRTLWNLGDFNSNITFPVDNTFTIGALSRRLGVFEGSTVNLRTSAGAATGAFYNPSTATWTANLSGSVYNLIPANIRFDGPTGNRSVLSPDGLAFSQISGFITTISMNTSSGTITANGNIQGASFNGKKHVSGLSSFSGGSVSVSTGLSSIDSAGGAPFTGGGNPTEYVGIASTSGGTVTYKSSNAGSGGFFFWWADGNP